MLSAACLLVTCGSHQCLPCACHALGLCQLCCLDKQGGDGLSMSQAGLFAQLKCFSSCCCSGGLFPCTPCRMMPSRRRDALSGACPVLPWPPAMADECTHPHAQMASWCRGRPCDCKQYLAMTKHLDVPVHGADHAAGEDCRDAGHGHAAPAQGGRGRSRDRQASFTRPQVSFWRFHMS